MVEVEEFSDKGYAICKTEKRVEPLIVEKDGSGFIFFKITSTKSSVPEELSGRYSSLSSGIKAVEDWERGASETVAARRSNYSKLRKETKVAAAEDTAGS